MSWQVTGDTHRWEPASGNVYTCTKVSKRSKRHFARFNGRIMGTPQIRVFYGSLEKCKELCERHWSMNHQGGEVP